MRIIDWSSDVCSSDLAHALSAFGVELIEQPVSAGEEDLLIGLKSPIPFCADESCHTHEDLDRLEGYQAVNIKLDKAGGLTEEIRLAEKARERGPIGRATVRTTVTHAQLVFRILLEKTNTHTER